MVKKLSKQRRWQLRKVAEGRCAICGEPRQQENGGTTLLCPKHHMAVLLDKRRVYAIKKGRTIPTEPKHTVEQLVEMKNRRRGK